MGCDPGRPRWCDCEWLVRGRSRSLTVDGRWRERTDDNAVSVVGRESEAAERGLLSKAMADVPECPRLDWTVSEVRVAPWGF